MTVVLVCCKRFIIDSDKISKTDKSVSYDMTNDRIQGDKKDTAPKTKDNKNSTDEAKIETKTGSTKNVEEKICLNPYENDRIRVLIRGKEGGGIYHPSVSLTCDTAYVVSDGKKEKKLDAGEQFTCGQKDNEGIITVTPSEGGNIKITDTGKGALWESTPAYSGIMECHIKKDGIILVNETGVESYLYTVVPSEMPSDYPYEALKAQAICARTYAYYHKQTYAYPECRAHVDDTTAFQVYNNIPAVPQTIKAVDETKNQIMCYDGRIIQAYYFSTSCGLSAGNGAWCDIGREAVSDYLTETGDDEYAEMTPESEAKFRKYIQEGNVQDIEFNEPWYRWSYEKELTDGQCGRFLGRLYELSVTYPDKIRIRSSRLPKKDIIKEAGIRDIRVIERRKSGLVTGIIIFTDNFSVTVSSQHYIRMALAGENDTVIKNDNSAFNMDKLLPSGFFFVENQYMLSAVSDAGNMGDKLNNADKARTNNVNKISNPANSNKKQSVRREYISSIKITGGGLGHGAGMSQNGAKCFALKGFRCADILTFYYKMNIINVEDSLERIDTAK